MTKFQDLTGRTFNMLTVVKRIKNGECGESRWLCKCECGNYKEVQGNNLKSGQVKSCGCLRIKTNKYKSTTHGLTKSRLYRTYQHMKDRCYRKNDSRYNRYGGRGISICNEWKNDFMSFYNWAINNGYKDNLTIDRIDNNGNYEPSNCRWVTIKEQCRNYSRNVLITYNNETYCITEWAERLNISRRTIIDRMNKKRTIEEILSTKRLKPIKKL